MAQLPINIPDARLPEVINAWAAYWGYSANAHPGETQNQFAKRMIQTHLRRAFAEGSRMLYTNTFTPPDASNLEVL